LVYLLVFPPTTLVIHDKRQNANRAMRCPSGTPASPFCLCPWRIIFAS
jgi:hypothetical protein